MFPDELKRELINSWDKQVEKHRHTKNQEVKETNQKSQIRCTEDNDIKVPISVSSNPVGESPNTILSISVSESTDILHMNEPRFERFVCYQKSHF